MGPGARVALTAGALALVLSASACSSADEVSGAAPPSGPVPGTQPADAPPDPLTSGPATAEPAPTSTSAPAVRRPAGLRPGAAGAEVLTLQRRLIHLRYFAGEADGRYGNLTTQAVMAFQKVEGLDRTGIAEGATARRLHSASAPKPLMADAEPTRLEFHTPTQVLRVIVDGRLRALLNASSGSGVPYCENGHCGDARTPEGRFRITRRIDGWRHAPLGDLYRPLYFNGGIAVHGSPSVPSYPASHGCIRISLAAAEWLPEKLPNGTPVYVIGSTTPEPFASAGAPPRSTTTGPPAPTTIMTAAPSTSDPPRSTTTAAPTTSTTGTASTTPGTSTTTSTTEP